MTPSNPDDILKSVKGQLKQNPPDALVRTRRKGSLIRTKQTKIPVVLNKYSTGGKTSVPKTI